MLQDEQQLTRQKLMDHAEFNGANVLEIGCGPGRVTAMYAHAPALTIGIEPDADCAAKASHTVPAAGFACASGMALPFADNTFDIALFTLSLHHHPDPALALKEAARVLRTNGRILVLEPKPESEIQRLCNIFENEDHRLHRAAKALSDTPLTLLDTEDFLTEWLFDDLNAVARYAFNYYNHPQDPAKRQAMRDFLGQRAEAVPVCMTDTLRLSCFKL